MDKMTLHDMRIDHMA